MSAGIPVTMLCAALSSCGHRVVKSGPCIPLWSGTVAVDRQAANVKKTRWLPPACCPGDMACPRMSP